MLPTILLLPLCLSESRLTPIQAEGMRDFMSRQPRLTNSTRPTYLPTRTSYPIHNLSTPFLTIVLRPLTASSNLAQGLNPISLTLARAWDRSQFRPTSEGAVQATKSPHWSSGKDTCLSNDSSQVARVRFPDGELQVSFLLLSSFFFFFFPHRLVCEDFINRPIFILSPESALSYRGCPHSPKVESRSISLPISPRTPAI